MTIIRELSFEDFEPWSGAVYTHQIICNKGKAELFDSVLEELYPEGLSETALNDILWFDSEWCLQAVGIKNEYEIRKQIDELECRIEELKEDFEEEAREMREAFETEKEAETAINEYWENCYHLEVANLEAEVYDLREELENLY